MSVEDKESKNGKELKWGNWLKLYIKGHKKVYGKDGGLGGSTLSMQIEREKERKKRQKRRSKYQMEDDKSK